ncbi:helix-turn-helix transcriptional regulator [Leifsonia sp. TF02-11]|uniref:ArsR/SmtB family transcription factor n=1 Tax=Leifsonia sp. TF02-11 TaxID=2815212 RepID=UPI001AA1BD2E|nr:helix-turn-helix domain-containing protein [Leifsonia sp. TF02-11]MBO1740755.1 helix-turn-helix transcriptional regulator [Leifsonia sp. TF02-11]
MPKRVDAGEWSEWLEDPIEALGSLVRAGIIGHLRQRGPATRAEIAAALDLPAQTVSFSLKPMLEAQLLLVDPPNPRRGQWVKYSVNEERVSRMYLQLGQAIGEV